MIRVLSGTVASRVLVTFFNFLTIAFAAQALGKEGIGVISLILLGITIIMLLNNLVGGAAIVYLVPRLGARSLLLPSYIWAVITALIFYVVVHFVDLVPERYSFHVLALAFIQSIYTVHFNILIGREQIKVFNIITVAQAVIVFAVFDLMLHVMNEPDPKSYVWALYAAYGTSLIASIIAVRKHLGEEKAIDPIHAFGRIIRYGAFTQSANVLQQLNYRLSYYIIEFYSGLGALGIYSIGTQLSEGAWITSKSMSMVQYARVSNTSDQQKNKYLTIAFIKLAVILTSVIMGILIVLPGSVYTWVFGPEIVGLRSIMLLLTPGILAMAASMMFSHYFSGTGAHHHNTIGSGIGLVVTLIAGFTLIPEYGLLGAAVTASLSYCTLTLYKGIVFIWLSKARILELLPNAADVRVAKTEWRKFRGSGSNQ